MCRKAFTIVEIALVIFVILMVASIFIPLNITNIEQAERIAKWKNTFEEAKYSFELLKAQDKKLFELNGNATSKQVFDKIKPYLNIEENNVSSDYFKNYKYTFLNGKRVNKLSNYYVDEFTLLKSDIIIGFRLNEGLNNDESIPYGIMLFDINGLKKPNKIGVDIFGINIYPNKIKAFGDGHSHSALKVNCSSLGTGVFCSKYYLIGGKI